MWGALSDLCRQDVLGWTASLTFPLVQIRKREENDRRTGTQPVGLKQCQQNFPFNLFNYKTLFVQLHLPQPQVAYLVSSTGHLIVRQHILIFMLHKLTWDCNNKEVSWNWEFSAETPKWHLGNQLRASSIILEVNCHFLTRYHTWWRVDRMDRELPILAVTMQAYSKFVLFSKEVLCAEMVQPLGPSKAKVTDLLPGVCASFCPAIKMGRAGANKERWLKVWKFFIKKYFSHIQQIGDNHVSFPPPPV